MYTVRIIYPNGKEKVLRYEDAGYAQQWADYYRALGCRVLVTPNPEAQQWGPEDRITTA